MSTSPDWREVRIRDITLKTHTWNPLSEPRETIRYVDVSAVSRETLAIDGANELSAATAPSRARKIIKNGDTIFATIRPRLKRVAQVSALYDDELASTAFCVLRPDRTLVDPDYLFFVASGDAFVEEVAGFETGASYPAVRDNDILDREIPLPPLPDQKQIAHALHAARAAMLVQVNSLAIAEELKRTVMRELFTRGLRGEAQKETEIGPVPESWEVDRLDHCADVISTRMSYSELEQLEQTEDDEHVTVLGIKVGDMNRPGNEVGLHHAELEKSLPRAVAEHRCAPPRTIIFPKRGAAIATNKKRISYEWTVFDPNVIGVVSQGNVDQEYLFHWFQGFDLRTITEPGPTPQLNKKNLEPVVVPVPPTLEEQREIVVILNTIDRTIDLHERKRVVLEDLFRALLHKLMSGEICVSDLDLSALDRSPLEGAPV